MIKEIESVAPWQLNVVSVDICPGENYIRYHVINRGTRTKGQGPIPHRFGEVVIQFLQRMQLSHLTSNDQISLRIVTFYEQWDILTHPDPNFHES